MSSNMPNNTSKALGQHDKTCDHCKTYFDAPCDVDLRMVTACTSCTFRQGGGSCVVSGLEMLPRPLMLQEQDWNELRQVCDSCHIQKKHNCSWLDGGVQARLGPCNNCASEGELCTRDGNVVPLPHDEIWVPGLFGVQHRHNGVDDVDVDMPNVDMDMGASDTDAPNAMAYPDIPDMQSGHQAHQAQLQFPQYQDIARTMEPQYHGAAVFDQVQPFPQPSSAHQYQTDPPSQSAYQPALPQASSAHQFQTDPPSQIAYQPALPQPSSAHQLQTDPPSQSAYQPALPPQPPVNTGFGPTSQSTVGPVPSRVRCPQCGPGSRKDFTARGLQMHIATIHRQLGPAHPSGQVNIPNPQAPVVHNQHIHNQHMIHGQTVNMMYQGQQPQAPGPQPQQTPGQPPSQRYTCDYCTSQKTYTAHGLKVHMNRKHPDEEVPDFPAPQVVVCPYCHGNYQARGLGVHILHRHPGLPCPDLKTVWQ